MSCLRESRTQRKCYTSGDYDLGGWSPDGEKMGKGVTLSEKELAALRGLLNNMET